MGGTTQLIRKLLEAGVHFGHQTQRWNPKMKSFIFGHRAGIHIIDLEKTEERLNSAADFLEKLSATGESILFVGTKKQAKTLLKDEALKIGMPYVVNRWLGGTLTNFSTIKRSINHLKQLREEKRDGLWDKRSKKEVKKLEWRLNNLEEHFSGLVDMDRLPGCLFIVDTKREQIAVKEANRLGIPIVALCDTNTDPETISYPIPGNDDAIRSVNIIVSVLVEHIAAGRRSYVVEAQAQQAEESAQGSSSKEETPKEEMPVEGKPQAASDPKEDNVDKGDN